MHLADIGVECFRTVTAVYGADGSWGARLAELATVLGAAGWGDFFSYGGGVPQAPRGRLEDQRPPVSGHWQQSPLPGGIESVPPGGQHVARLVRVGWASRGEPADPQWTLDGRWHMGGSPQLPLAQAGRAVLPAGRR